jgi:pilus assembly protein CpaB
MRGRTVILFLVALLLAGGTAALVRSWLAQRPTVAAVPQAAPKPVQKAILVANTAIARGQILKPGDVVWRPWPDTAIAGDLIVSGAQPEKSFAGWVAREPFAAGEPVVRTKIVAPGERGFLAAVLKPGMRAVSVAVDQTTDVSGFIFPGDRVDVLITVSVPADNGSNDNSGPRKGAATILRDIRVIAIDQRLESKDGQAVVARTVTLEVSPKESEILALAADMSGKLSLSLRSLVTPARHEPGVVAFNSAGGGDSVTDPAPDGGETPDSSDGHASGSFTLEGELSPLLRKPLGIKHNSNGDKVCILRGNGTSANGCESQPGS